MSVPSDLGRLPGNIQSNYGGFTASQWKNFVLYYSMFALKGILPESHMHYWQSFVLACRLICKPCISKTDLMIADKKFLHFATEYERINGKLAISPNIHLHLHLQECVQNYGSVYGFWLFSFERYNGILESYSTNNKNIEVQIMRKFVTSGLLACKKSVLPEDFSDFFLPHCLQQLETQNISQTEDSLEVTLASRGPLPGNEMVWTHLDSFCMTGQYKLQRLDSDDLSSLRTVYLKLYPELDTTSLDLAVLVKKYKSLTFAGETYGSQLHSRLIRYGGIMASWCGENGDVNPIMMRPGIVNSYIVHSIQIEGEQKIHAFATVRWLKPSTNDLGFGNPLSVWYLSSYERSGPATFLPVQRIYSRFVFAEESFEGQKYAVISPLCWRTLL